MSSTKRNQAELDDKTVEEKLREHRDLFERLEGKDLRMKPEVEKALRIIRGEETVDE